jgi:hypothetical protein
MALRLEHRSAEAAREGRAPGEGVVEDAAERVDVGRRPRLGALELLGGDVVETVERGARARDALGGRRPARRAEVGEVHVLDLALR